MKKLSANELFTPIQVAAMELKHRVVMVSHARGPFGRKYSGDLMLASIIRNPPQTVGSWFLKRLSFFDSTC